jgi:prevent-host-death family protein
MTQVALLDAKQRLAELVAAAEAGEDIVITHDDRGVRLVPIPSPTEVNAKSGFGSCRGLIWMAEDFDAPLDELREYME